MEWLLVIYFIGLLYLALNPNKIIYLPDFRTAWIGFIMIPASRFVFMILRINMDKTKEVFLVEQWSIGTAWLLLAISLFFLLNSLVPNE